MAMKPPFLGFCHPITFTMSPMTRIHEIGMFKIPKKNTCHKNPTIHVGKYTNLMDYAWSTSIFQESKYTKIALNCHFEWISLGFTSA